MYKVEYINEPKDAPKLKKISNTITRIDKADSDIKSITIDIKDILNFVFETRPYIETKLLSFYASFRRPYDDKKIKIDEKCTIPNTDRYKYLISAIMHCDWLVNKDAIADNYDELINHAQAELNAINERLITETGNARYLDKRRSLLIEYYIDTILEKRELEVSNHSQLRKTRNIQN